MASVSGQTFQAIFITHKMQISLVFYITAQYGTGKKACLQNAKGPSHVVTKALLEYRQEIFLLSVHHRYSFYEKFGFCFVCS